MLPTQMINPILAPTQPIVRRVANDTDVGIVVKYVGSQASATVTVSSAGDITFKHGDAGSEAVDSTIDSGGDDPGVIDVSDSNADTMGEVVDLINASANWEAYLKDALRAHNSNNSTGSLLALSETTMTPNETETDLVMDTSKMLTLSIRVGSRDQVNGTEENSAAMVTRIISKNTFGSGTNKIQVYKVDELKKTETKIFERDGAATTVEQDITDLIDSLGAGGIAVGKTGEHLLVRMIGSAACSGYLQEVGSVTRGA